MGILGPYLRILLAIRGRRRGARHHNCWTAGALVRFVRAGAREAGRRCARACSHGAHERLFRPTKLAREACGGGVTGDRSGTTLTSHNTRSPVLSRAFRVDTLYITQSRWCVSHTLCAASDRRVLRLRHELYTQRLLSCDCFPSRRCRSMGVRPAYDASLARCSRARCAFRVAHLCGCVCRMMTVGCRQTS